MVQQGMKLVPSVCVVKGPKICVQYLQHCMSETRNLITTSRTVVSISRHLRRSPFRLRACLSVQGQDTETIHRLIRKDMFGLLIQNDLVIHMLYISTRSSCCLYGNCMCQPYLGIQGETTVDICHRVFLDHPLPAHTSCMELG